MVKSLNWRDWLSVKRKADQEQAVDYSTYVLDIREWCICLAQGMLIVVILAWFFYRSPAAVLPLSLLLVFWKQSRVLELAGRRRRELAVQFRDLILSVSAGLQAGYSMENAFVEAGHEMRGLYGENSLIAAEMDRVQRGIRSNIPLENLLLDLGRRSADEDIGNFAEVFSIAKRSGGNMKEIIQRSAAMIGDKIAVKREIQTILAARKYEQKIMNLIPVLIIAYLQLTSGGFFDVLYGNLPGVLIMTGALAVYLAAYRISGKIVEIEV